MTRLFTFCQNFSTQRLIIILGIIHLQKYLLAKALAGLGLEDMAERMLNTRPGYIVFEEVDEEVGLHKNLIVDAIYISIGVVVPDYVADALDVLRVKALPGQELACRGGAELLLILAVGVAIFGLGSMDADIVDHGRHLRDQLGMSIHMFLAGDELREAMNLEKMLDAHGITLVKRYHG